MSNNIETTERQKKFRSEIERSGLQIQASFIVYLGILIYFFVSVTSTTDGDLLHETSKSIPLLNIDIPLVWFFAVGPWAFTLIHINQLLQYYYSTKIGPVTKSV